MTDLGYVLCLGVLLIICGLALRDADRSDKFDR